MTTVNRGSCSAAEKLRLMITKVITAAPAEAGDGAPPPADAPPAENTEENTNEQTNETSGSARYVRPIARENVSFRLWLVSTVTATVVFLLMIVGFVTFSLYVTTVNDMSRSIWKVRAEAAAARMSLFLHSGGDAGADGAVLAFLRAETQLLDGMCGVHAVSPEGAVLSLTDYEPGSDADIVEFKSAANSNSGLCAAPSAEFGVNKSANAWTVVLDVRGSDIERPVGIVSGALLRVNAVAIVFAFMAAYLTGTRMSYHIRAIIDNVLFLGQPDSEDI